MSSKTAFFAKEHRLKSDIIISIMDAIFDILLISLPPPPTHTHTKTNFVMNVSAPLKRSQIDSVAHKDSPASSSH